MYLHTCHSVCNCRANFRPPEMIMTHHSGDFLSVCVCVWIEHPCHPPGTDIPSALAFPCSFHTTALLIKHNLLPISALFASLLTHTRSPSPFLAALPHLVMVAPNQGPVAKATSISFLKCQFALLSSRFHFPAIISLTLSLFRLFCIHNSTQDTTYTANI